MDPWCLLEEMAARVLLAAGGLLGCRKELMNHAQTLQVVVRGCVNSESRGGLSSVIWSRQLKMVLCKCFLDGMSV